MSVPEVMFRFRRAITQRKEQHRVEAGWKPLPAVAVKPKSCLFGEDRNLIREWNKYFELDQGRLEEYLAGHIDFFGHKPLDTGSPVAWHRDPVTGIESPQTFGKSLNYRDDNLVGNVKFTWELGRHQHLVPLTVAYVVTGDVRYRQMVTDQIDGWIAQNPFGLGIHWCTSLEVSLRLISWAVVHSLLVLRDGKQGLFAVVQDGDTFGNSIYQQAYFVRHFLSRFSSANNHLIGELTGLWVACQVFDLGKKGDEWSAFSQKELEHESIQQVHSDGVDKEQAFYYHLWVLEYFFFVWMVSTRSDQPFSDEFTRKIMAMVRFLKDVSPEEAEPPQVGDADDGFVARFEPEWPDKPYEELLAAVDSVFGVGDPDCINQKAFWYRAIVPEDAIIHSKLDWSRTYPVIYPDGGYAVLGSAECHLVFDAGPLGYPGIAAHGHADALSFSLAIDGLWWLVDPGTYAYHSAPEWRSYFRGTAAHNTIRINGEDQSQIAGPFMWLRQADAWIDSSSEISDIQEVGGHHDGYGHLGVIHHRSLRFSSVDRQLEVLDTLRGSGEKAKLAEIYYHFAPDVDITPEPGGHYWVATRKGSEKRLIVYPDPSWRYEVVRGGTNPISGWYSPGLEEKVPANTLRGKANWVPSLKCVTRFVVG